VPGQEPTDRALADLGQARAQFLDRGIRRFLQHRKDRLLMSLDPTGPTITTKGGRSSSC